ncbi:MAG: hypothetical protein J6D02_10605 [Lachnospira sp.]|nr:hypothetical protein [Lachnospira sp.]
MEENKTQGKKRETTGKKQPVKAATGKKTGKPEHTRIYVMTSIIGNFILGAMGLGLGFLFFLTKVIATGSIVLNFLVFFVGAIIIVLYLYIILLANRWLVRRCSNKKSKRSDKNRLFFSMLYVISILIISLAYSFLRAAIEVNLIS